VACKDWHDIPAGPEKWMRVLYTEKGKFPNVFVSHLIGPCFHCVNPVCANACPVDAIAKRGEDCIVVVDREACLGNEECDVKCRKACPYDAPQFGPEKGAKMGKCNFCVDRWTVGSAPVCVESCPVRAMDAGALPDLEAKYGAARDAEGFSYSKRTQPAVVFKPKICKI
jgi:anaerobic dimethyl sulfoxide reductase subunit B (iron-sulfur subunit)